MAVQNLDQWLSIATRKLAPASIEQVRREIGEHYQSAVEAGHWDLAMLGSPGKANCAYRKVLLTSAEAKFLERGSFAAGSWSWWLMAALGLMTVFACAVSWTVTGHMDLVWRTWPIGPLLLLQYVGPLLPIRTPARLRIWQIVRRIGFVIAMLLLIASWNNSTLSIVTQFFVAFTFQAMRASIRRKLPVSKWPDGAYC